MENISFNHSLPFTSDAPSIHEYAGQHIEIQGELLSEIHEGTTVMQVYVGFELEACKNMITSVLLSRGEVVSVKRYLFLPEQLAENSYNINEKQNIAADAEKPTYFSVVIFAQAGKAFYMDEISIEELSKSISKETYAALAFDELAHAERFIQFLKS